MSAMGEKKRGAPRGNQNARKHGFYSGVLSEVERQDFEQATGMLARLLRTKNNIDKKDKQGLKAAIGNVLKDIALPLGIGIGATIKG